MKNMIILNKKKKEKRERYKNCGRSLSLERLGELTIYQKQEGNELGIRGK